MKINEQLKNIYTNKTKKRATEIIVGPNLKLHEQFSIANNPSLRFT